VYRLKAPLEAGLRHSQNGCGRVRPSKGFFDVAGLMNFEARIKAFNGANAQFCPFDFLFPWATVGLKLPQAAPSRLLFRQTFDIRAAILFLQTFGSPPKTAGPFPSSGSAPLF